MRRLRLGHGRRGAGHDPHPEMIAALPSELRQEMERRLCALLLDLGVKPMITPDGHKVFDIAELAPAIGMSVDEAHGYC